MVYGHREKGDCGDIEVMAPIGKPDASKITAAINDITPKGKTPIGASLQKAAESLRFTEDPATVILISDGEESCGADPCTVAKELKSKGINFTAHVVGFDIQGNTQAQAQLKCVADSTGGKFFEAKDAAGLQIALAETAKAVAAKPEPPPTPTSSMKMETVESHGVDDPLPTELGVIYKLTLKKDEDSYFKLAKPASNIKIIFDAQQMEKKDTNLDADVSITDQDGVTIKKNIIHIGGIDVAYRKKALFSSEQESDFGFRVFSGYSGNFYLTVMNPDDTELVPFFGEVMPSSMEIDNNVSGKLDVNGDAYYTIHLAKGNYKAILDFANSEHKSTNMAGYLALLDPDGGDIKPGKPINFHGIDVSSRQSAIFPIEEEGTYVFRIANRGPGMDYKLKIVQSQ